MTLTAADLRKALEGVPDDYEIMSEMARHFGPFPIRGIEICAGRPNGKVKLVRIENDI